MQYWLRARIEETKLSNITDSSQLPLDIRQIILANRTLKIVDVQRRQDSGQYKCVARNKAGQIAEGFIDVSVLGKKVYSCGLI